ncbi:MAG: GMC family oxidoreductase [Pseudomonadota bacterium]
MSSERTSCTCPQKERQGCGLEARAVITDARNLPSGEQLECDVCIVGAGIAGISLARSLEQSGMRVVILESGGLHPTPETDALSDGESNLPDYPFAASRVRSFGGSSCAWTGACIQMDEADFESRSWVPHSGWPIKARDISPYLDRARETLGLPEKDRLRDDLAKTPLASDIVTAKTVAYATPRNVGARFQSEIEKSASINCLLNATVTNLGLEQDGERINKVKARTLDGSEMEVAARSVVLTAGGLENARLLLASNDVAPEGVGNSHDTVGRYHMEHPIRAVGTLSIRPRQHRQYLPYTDVVKRDGVALKGTFGVSAKCRQNNELLDMNLLVYRYSMMEEMASVVGGKALAQDGVTVGKLLEYAATHNVRFATEVLPYIGWHVWNKVHKCARFNHVRFMAFVEQEPNPENRIALSDRRDALGVPLAKLTYSESARMEDSMHRSLAIMSQDFEARGVGTLRYRADEIRHLRAYDAYGLHPMGSTRMSRDPKHGVVDADCRVHGVKNLFVASCSVFPTGGAANPTWTIVALALRLGDYLRQNLRTLPA